MNFNSVTSQALEQSLDATWLKTKMISGNIANYETPGYKAKEVSFEEVFSSVGADGNKKTASYRTQVKDDPSTSMRADGNNVSMEKEQLELWRAYAQYNALVQKISGNYNNLRYVIKNTAK